MLHLFLKDQIKKRNPEKERKRLNRNLYFIKTSFPINGKTNAFHSETFGEVMKNFPGAEKKQGE